MNDHCCICDEKIAPFLIEDRRYCAEHWRATGHFVDIQLKRRNEVIEEDAPSSQKPHH